jgi:hypothetical protein
MARWSVERPKWKLAFHSPPKLPIFTNEEIKDEHGNPLKVILVDVDIGESIWDLPNLQQIELVPLLGNFPWDYGRISAGREARSWMASTDRLTMWDGRGAWRRTGAGQGVEKEAARAAPESRHGGGGTPALGQSGSVGEVRVWRGEGRDGATRCGIHGWPGEIWLNEARAGQVGSGKPYPLRPA